MKNKKGKKYGYGVALLTLTACCFSVVGCGANTGTGAADTVGESADAVDEAAVVDYDFAMKLSDIPTGNVSSAGVAVHDPSILEVDGTYYIYGSHMTAAKSSDLLNWEMIGDGYVKTNPVYGQIYDVQDEAFAYAGAGFSTIKTDDSGTHVWAPDVIYNKANGLYYMYYCTSSTWNASNLCYGISESPEGPFEWQGALIYSGFNYSNLKETDVLDYVDEDYAHKNYIKSGAYNYDDYPNAIDPTVFYDKDDRLWMVYGSWSGGIFLLELDPETGLVIHPEADPDNRVDAYFGKKLLGGGHISIEAPYILYDENDGFYYLFVSYGGLVSNGGYQIRVFRSETVDGTYVDMNGSFPEKSAEHSTFGLKLSGNYKLPSLEKAYMATGHNSAFIDKDGKMYVVYHTRFNDNGENHSPRAHQMFANAQGWLCELPYQTQGETISDTGYATEAIVGRYFVTNSGTGIDAEIANPIILYLNEDGTVIGRESSGTWTKTDNTYFMDINIDGVDYSGIFCQMKDEAGADVMTFSAVGANTTTWGVKYMK